MNYSEGDSSTDIDCNELLNEMGLNTNDSNSELPKKNADSNKQNNKNEIETNNDSFNKNELNSSFHSDDNNFEIFSASQDISSSHLSKENDNKSNKNKKGSMNDSILNATVSEVEDIPSSGSFKQSIINDQSSLKSQLANDKSLITPVIDNVIEQELSPANSEIQNSLSISQKEKNEHNSENFENIFIENDSNQEMSKETKETKKSSPQKKTKNTKENKRTNNKQTKKKNNRKPAPVIDLSSFLDNPPKQNENTFDFDLDFLNFSKKDTNKTPVNNSNEQSIVNTTINDSNSIPPIQQQKMENDNLPETALEQRITDYFNLSLKKLVTDFTNELSGLLGKCDNSNSIFKKFAVDIQKCVEDAINFSNDVSNNNTLISTSNNSGLLSSFSINPTNIYQTSTINDNYTMISDAIDPYTNEFKAVLRTVPRNFIFTQNETSDLKNCISQLHLKSDSMNNQFLNTLTEMHKMVEKSSQHVSHRINNMKTQKNHNKIYEKLYDLEKRELEHRIQSQLFEQQKQSFENLNGSYQPLSFYEDDLTSRKMRTLSSFPSKEKVMSKVSSFIEFINENKDSILRRDSVRERLNSREFLEKLEKYKDESRSLRQSFRMKTQEFCSRASLLSMENQSQKEKQLSSTLSMMASRQMMNVQNNSLAFAPNSNNSKAIPENTILMNQKTNNSLFENEQMINDAQTTLAEMDIKMKRDVEETQDFLASLNRRKRKRKEHIHHHHRHSIITPSRGSQNPNLNISSDLDLSDNNENMQVNRKNESIKNSHKTAKYQNDHKLKIKSSYL